MLIKTNSENNYLQIFKIIIFGIDTESFRQKLNGQYQISARVHIVGLKYTIINVIFS